MSAWLAVLTGAATGVLSGMGIGGGTLLVIVLVELAHIEQRAAQGINLLYFLPVAAASLIAHIRSRRIRMRVFLLCAAAYLITSHSLRQDLFSLNGTCAVWGVTLVGVELGYILMYRAG